MVTKRFAGKQESRILKESEKKASEDSLSNRLSYFTGLFICNGPLLTLPVSGRSPLLEWTQSPMEWKNRILH